jgi:hypothetical protein
MAGDIMAWRRASSQIRRPLRSRPLALRHRSSISDDRGDSAAMLLYDLADSTVRKLQSSGGTNPRTDGLINGYR